MLTVDDLRELARFASLPITADAAALARAALAISKMLWNYGIDCERRKAVVQPTEAAKRVRSTVRKIDAPLADLDISDPAKGDVFHKPGAVLAVLLDDHVTRADRVTPIGAMMHELLPRIGGLIEVGETKAGERITARIEESDAKAIVAIASAAASLKALRTVAGAALRGLDAENADRNDAACKSLMRGLAETYEELHGRGYTVSTLQRRDAGRNTARDTKPAGAAMAWTGELLRIAAERDIRSRRAECRARSICHDL